MKRATLNQHLAAADTFYSFGLKHRTAGRYRNAVASFRQAAREYRIAGDEDMEKKARNQADSIDATIHLEAVKLPPRKIGGRRKQQERSIIMRERIFNFICTYKERNDGVSPTCRDIAREVGISSTSVVFYYLEKLQLAGLIKSAHYGARGIQVVGGCWKRNCDEAG